MLHTLQFCIIGYFQVLGKGVPKFTMRPRAAAPKSEALVGGAKAGPCSLILFSFKVRVSSQLIVSGVVAPGPGAYTFHDPGAKKISLFGKMKEYVDTQQNLFCIMRANFVCLPSKNMILIFVCSAKPPQYPGPQYNMPEYKVFYLISPILRFLCVFINDCLGAGS